MNDVYVLAPNYQAGKDMVTGFKRYYKGRIVEEIYTKLGQQDYQAEITQLRAKNPKAVFVFYPGGMGMQFVRQYDQAGLRERIPLYSVFTVDEITLPGDQGSGARPVRDALLEPGPGQRRRARSTSATSARSTATRPSFYGAQSYDGILLIDSAVQGGQGQASRTPRRWSRRCARPTTTRSAAATSSTSTTTRSRTSTC